MNRSSAPHHAAHDELLLARLFGEDLDGPERERALGLVESCAECAAAYADFATLAGAVARMRTPERPRDFTLTEEAAAAAKRRLGLRAAIGALRRLGPVRSVGATMAAVGVAGMLAVGAVSLLAPGGTSIFDRFQAGAANLPAVPAAASSVGSGYKSGVSDQGELAAPSASPLRSAPAAPSAGGPTAAATAAASPNGPLTAVPSASVTASTGWLVQAASPAPVTGPGTQERNGGSSGHGATGASGPDGRTVVLSGLGLLAAVGVVIVLAPYLGRRWRSRRTR